MDVVLNCNKSAGDTASVSIIPFLSESVYTEETEKNNSTCHSNIKRMKRVQS